MKHNGKVVQFHHIQYQHKKPGNKRESCREVLAPMYMYEHSLVSKIQRLKPENCSREFWESLEVLISMYKPLSKSLREQLDVKH